MRILYPSIKPNHVQSLKVEHDKTLHVLESGDSQGVPVLVLHDGPGIGSRPGERRLFDPQKYRIIQFDQRGSGQSTPYASTEHNHTQAILQDIEAIRQKLGIEQWIVFGYGWGAALALAYAQKISSSILSLICVSSALSREEDLLWRYQNGAKHFFPDFWQNFSLNEKSKDSLLASYQKKLAGQDELMRMATAKSWAKWHAHIMAMQPNTHLVEVLSNPHTALSYATLSCHFWLHDAITTGEHIFNQMDKLDKIPGYIIHGRFDMLSPLDIAWQLNEQWPNAELCTIRDAGHGLQEPGIVDAILLVTDKIAQAYTHSA